MTLLFTLMINLVGIILMALTFWWFFISSERAKKVTDQVITIQVKDGIYEPAKIKIAARSTIVLRFIREDPAPCAEMVIFPSLNLNYSLPLHKPFDVALESQPVGTVDFMCHTGTYKGRLIIE
ncbi:MAG TPA: cupredoxin domain-containing protein [Gammaproteobacteria bacterium]|nr:cupredoxin domain-containing protein [Gammaproteobacteria bacterium]